MFIEGFGNGLIIGAIAGAGYIFGDLVYDSPWAKYACLVLGGIGGYVYFGGQHEATTRRASNCMVQ